MAFVNEWISKEDIKKYGFGELTEKYVRLLERDGFLDKPNWTVDREREIWLKWFRNETDLNIDHGRTRESLFILHYKGVNIEARVWLEEDSQTNIYKTPFVVIWKLLSLSPTSIKGADEDEIKLVLQEALSIYGHRGVHAQGEGKNAIVQFRNF
jgi:hypothetical protein